MAGTSFAVAVVVVVVLWAGVRKVVARAWPEAEFVDEQVLGVVGGVVVGDFEDGCFRAFFLLVWISAFRGGRLVGLSSGWERGGRRTLTDL